MKRRFPLSVRILRSALSEMPHRSEVIMGGDARRHQIGSRSQNPPRSKPPTKYANFDLEGHAGSPYAAFCGPDDFLKFGELVQPDAIVPGARCR